MMTCTIYASATLTLCLLIVSNCWASYDLDEKFAQLDNKLDIILKHLGEQPIGQVTTGTKPGSGDHGIPLLQPVVIPLEVSRESVGGDEFRFKIKYRAMGDGQVQWFATTMGKLEKVDFVSSDDVQETSYTVRFANDTYMYIMANFVSIGHVYAEVGFELSRELDSYEIATDVVVPQMGILPASDFVYEKGKNMTIKLQVPFEDENDYSYDSGLQVHVALVDEERDVFVNYFRPENDMYQILEMKNKSDSRVMTVRLNTAKYSPIGFVVFSFTGQGPSEKPLFRIRISKHVIIRPSSQSGPLPEGFLGFREMNFIQENICSASPDEKCDIECLAVGNNITDLNVFRIDPDGSRTRITDLISDSGFGSALLYNNMKLIGGTLPPPPIKTGTVQYECVAENDVHGIIRTKTYQYNYYVPLEIDEDRSGVRILNENESSTIRRLAVVCVVHGSPTPTPDVTFNIDQVSSYDWYVQPDDFVDDGMGEFTATKFVTFDTNNPDGSYYGEYKGKLLSAECIANYNGSYAFGYGSYNIKPIPEQVRK